MSALVMGMLNAKLVFGWPAMAATFFNIGSIGGSIICAYVIEPQAHWLHPQFTSKALSGLAIGVLIGGFLQLLVQLPPLFRVGFRPRLDFNWKDKGVGTVLRIMAPAVIAASAVQVNVMVNTSFASHCEAGSVVWLNNAFRLMQLPLGIFGVAIGTVTLPLLSKSVAMGRGDDFRSTLARGMRLAFLLTVPATLGLILLAKQIMTLIYGHGLVTPYQTTQMSASLQYYAIGLAAYSAMKVLTPAFYAIDQKTTPMIISFIAIGTNLLLNWFFTFRLGLGQRGLALSTSLVATVNFLVFYAIMRKHAKGLESHQMLVTFAKIAVSGLALAAVCVAAHFTILAMWEKFGFLQRLLSLAMTIVVAGGAFFATASALKIDEISDLTRMVKRKFGAKRNAS
jgi:putative peptidoglycan lipid II flippase